MDNGSDVYGDIVPGYIRLLALECPEAASDVEQISLRFGARAALRATLVLSLVTLDVQKTRTLQSIDTYDYLMTAFPEAQPLLEHAIECCLQAWGIKTVAPPALDDGPAADPDETTRTPVLPPLPRS